MISTLSSITLVYGFLTIKYIKMTAKQIQDNEKTNRSIKSNFEKIIPPKEKEIESILSYFFSLLTEL